MRQLSESVRAALNDPARIAERDMWFDRMRNVFDSVEDDFNRSHAFVLHGVIPRPADNDLAYTDPEEWTLQCLELLAENLPDTTERFAPPCVEYPIYGVHFIDRMFGADVYFYEDQWNARYLDTPVGQLKMPDLETDETWALARRSAEAFLAADVKLPLFGMPTLSSALNIMVNLYGERALIAMLEDEEAAQHDLVIINDLIRTLHRWYREHIPSQQLQPVISWERTQPPGAGQLCGCTTQLLSGALYGEMIAPLDDALLGDYPRGGMIHLCGHHTQHIPIFREMKHLRALQLNDDASRDLEKYLAGLREDQIIYLYPYEGMTAEEALRISGNKRIIFIGVEGPEVRR